MNLNRPPWDLFDALFTPTFGEPDRLLIGWKHRICVNKTNISCTDARSLYLVGHVVSILGLTHTQIYDPIRARGEHHANCCDPLGIEINTTRHCFAAEHLMLSGKRIGTPGNARAFKLGILHRQFRWRL